MVDHQSSITGIILKAPLVANKQVRFVAESRSLRKITRDLERYIEEHQLEVQHCGVVLAHGKDCRRALAFIKACACLARKK